MIRRIIFVLIVILFGVFVYFNRDDVLLISAAIARGKTVWLIVALLAEFCYFFIYTLIFKYALELVGLRRTLLELGPLVFGAFLVNMLAPATGHAGTILFADDSKKRNESISKTIVGVFITFIAIYLALTVFLILGIINLRIIGELGFGEITASIFYLILTLAPIVAIWSGQFRPNALRRVLTFIYKVQQKILTLFKRNIKATKSWVENSTLEIIEAGEAATKNPRQSFFLIFLGLVSHFINIVCILFIFFSLGFKLKYGIAITGYAFGEIVRVISPQPEGVGTVEVTMVLIFSLFGIPPLIATTAVILYRAMNIWVPMLIGLVSLRTLKTFKRDMA